MGDIFEELDKCDLEIRKEKRRKEKFRLGLYNKLFRNGHIAQMGDATLTYLLLGDKCTAQATFNGEIYYLVYGGKFSKDIISELQEARGKSRNSIWRDLEYLKKKKMINYKTKDGVGTRIVIKPIRDAFERKFKESKKLGQSDVGKNGQQVSQNGQQVSQNGQQVSQNDLRQNGVGKEKVKENKGNSEMAKNGSPCTMTYTKTKETTTSDVAVEIFQIFKGSMKQSKIQNLIKGKDPDEMLRLAHYCSEKGENPPGLFTTMLKEGTKPPIPATKTRPYIPPPSGGYQSGKEPLISPRQFVPEQVIALFQQNGEPEHIVDNKLWKFLDRYHEKQDPKNYYAYRQDLTQEEVANMLAVAEGIKKESIKQ